MTELRLSDQAVEDIQNALNENWVHFFYLHNCIKNRKIHTVSVYSLVVEKIFFSKKSPYLM